MISVSEQIVPKCICTSTPPDTPNRYWEMYKKETDMSLKDSTNFDSTKPNAKWTVGDKVTATQMITEDHLVADRTAKFPSPHYIHADSGDHGVIEYIDDDGCPTVRFYITGTSTIIGDHEIKHLQTPKFKVGDIVKPNGSCTFLRDQNCFAGIVLSLDREFICVKFSPSGVTYGCNKFELELSTLGKENLPKEIAPTFTEYIEEICPTYETVIIHRAWTDKNQVLLVKQSALDKIGRHNINWLAASYQVDYDTAITSRWLENLATEEWAIVGSKTSLHMAIELNDGGVVGNHTIHVILEDIDSVSHTSPWMTHSFNQCSKSIPPSWQRP